MRYMRKLHPDLDILVSSIGEVFVPQSGARKAHWTFGSKGSDGYRRVKIDGKAYKVHRLVAQTFIPNPKNKPQVDHISRQKDQNSVDNLRWSTPSENSRNTSQHDRVDARGGTHWYEDEKQYKREHNTRYYAENKEKECERVALYRAEHPEKAREQCSRNYAKNRDKRCEWQASYYQAKKKTHRLIRFADGSQRWVPLPEADAYLIIPLKERHYHGK